jgi:hypothetical protein
VTLGCLRNTRMVANEVFANIPVIRGYRLLVLSLRVFASLRETLFPWQRRSFSRCGSLRMTPGLWLPQDDPRA